MTAWAWLPVVETTDNTACLWSQKTKNKVSNTASLDDDITVDLPLVLFNPSKEHLQNLSRHFYVVKAI